MTAKLLRMPAMVQLAAFEDDHCGGLHKEGALDCPNAPSRWIV